MNIGTKQEIGATLFLLLIASSIFLIGYAVNIEFDEMRLRFTCGEITGDYGSWAEISWFSDGEFQCCQDEAITHKGKHKIKTTCT